MDSKIFDKAFEDAYLPLNNDKYCYICRIIINEAPLMCTLNEIKEAVMLNYDVADDCINYKHILICSFPNTLQALSDMLIIRRILANVNVEIIRLNLPLEYDDDQWLHNKIQMKLHNRYTHCLTLNLGVKMILPLYVFIKTQCDHFDNLQKLGIIKRGRFNFTFLYIKNINPIKKCITYKDASVDAFMTLCNHSHGSMFLTGDSVLDEPRLSTIDVNIRNYKDLPNLLNPLILNSSYSTNSTLSNIELLKEWQQNYIAEHDEYTRNPRFNSEYWFYLRCRDYLQRCINA
ncbi:hypothetical protein MrNuV_ORF052 [Macrobrachium rosenbergii nudivirus]|nr:hypothetical protein MrNuV_ORF052 [Macrobrachium rosenbergii nudivirus]